MLSRTAANLYWLSRNMERAECLARILDAHDAPRPSLPQAEGVTTNEWDSAIATAGCARFVQSELRRSQRADRHRFSRLLGLQPRPRSAIASRPRGRMRAPYAPPSPSRCGTRSTAPGTNSSTSATANDLARRLLALSALCAGILAALRRLRLPHHAAQRRLLVFAPRHLIERADNTARILDVKYHLLLPDKERVGGPLDYFQWAAILRSVSALTTYHWVYRESVKPWLVADLLILNRQMPRSLGELLRKPLRYLDDLAQSTAGRGLRSARRARSAPDSQQPRWRIFSSTACTNSSRASSPRTIASATPSPNNI